MGTPYEIRIPKPEGDTLALVVETGCSIVIVGANGSGKTRLGVYAEEKIPAQKVHRIAAQKSLALNDAVQLSSLESAENALRFGTPNGHPGHKPGSRWGNKPAVHFLNDFDALLQRLFAEHNRTANEFLEKAETDRTTPVPMSKLRQLKDMWDGLLPHRALKLRETTVQVLVARAIDQAYAGSEMSDGERAIFYFLGQCLVAPDESVIIIDEPEAHVHKAILGPLWDAIEKARRDCGFLYITHDVDFAVTRPAAATYFIRSYTHNPQAWDIVELPKDTGLPDNIVAEIVGSRKPILFVEGERGSIDITIYRDQYPGFTIVPIGACDAVIRSVATYKNSGELHWLDAMGLIDADHRSAESIATLEAKRVHVLPVAEVENLLLLPEVFSALAEALALDPVERLNRLTEKLLQVAKEQAEAVSVRYTSRQLDERLKRINSAAKDLATLDASYKHEIARIDPIAIFHEFKAAFEKAIQDRDVKLVLKLFDNKTLLSLAANVLDLKDNAQKLMGRVERLLGDKEKGEKVRAALMQSLPVIPVPTAATPRQNNGGQQNTPVAAIPAGQRS